MSGRCTGGQHHAPVDGGHCPCGVVSRHPVATIDATAGGGLLGDCRGCDTPVNDYRAHVWAERTCCPDCDHRPLPALRDVLAAARDDAQRVATLEAQCAALQRLAEEVEAAAARDAEKVRRVEELADWLDKCAEDTDRPNGIVAANVTPERLALLGRVYRDDADRIRRALDAP